MSGTAPVRLALAGRGPPPHPLLETPRAHLSGLLVGLDPTRAPAWDCGRRSSPLPLWIDVRGPIHAELTPSGMAVEHGDDELALQTVRVGTHVLEPEAEPTRGCAPELSVQREPVPGACQPAMLLDHWTTTEWWSDTDVGLRQGWTLHAPLDSDPVVEIELVPTRGWLLDVDPNGEAATFEGTTGRTWRYTDLTAWDADDRMLTVWMAPTPQGLVVVVDTTGARFPVVVDPILSTEDKLTASDAAADAVFGTSMSRAGDLNGDGYGDLLVGAPGADGAATESGQAYVYYGSASGLDAGTEQALQGTGGSQGDEYGDAVAGGGDIDNDGYDDVAVGARYVDIAGTAAGGVYLYYGSATGVATGSEQLLISSDRASGDQFGGSVDLGGDINGDGYAELLVGARGDDDGADRTGSMYLYFGSATGLSAASEQKLHSPTAAFYDQFGWDVAFAGDVDADGYGEVVGGTYYGQNTAGQSSGTAYLFYGTATGADTGSATLLEDSRLPINTYFGTALAGGGDVDGDGYDDVLVGAQGADLTGTRSGYVYVYFGSATGVSNTNVQAVTSSDGETFDWFGFSVDGGHDVDRDGYDDVLVGAPGEDDSGSKSGAAYLLYGSASGLVLATEVKLTASDAAADADFGHSVALTDDLDGNSVADLAVGAPGDTEAGSAAGGVYAYAGDCAADVDGDGVCAFDDCDDTDADIYPGAPDTVGDGVDSDCDGTETCYADNDDDGYADRTTTVVSSDTDCDDSGEATDADPVDDCDDADAQAYPGAPELTGDETDQDCDGTEVCYVDTDGDGYTDGTTTVASSDLDCSDSTEATASMPTGDCDETDASIHPAATEGVGDGTDQDCDGTEVCYADADHDGYTDHTTTVQSIDTDCTDAGEATAWSASGECDDTDPSVHPGVGEVVGDGIDGDCDGTEVCYADTDEDGYADRTTTVVSTDTDCADPGEAGLGTAVGDCDDDDATAHPGAAEVPGDSIDSDCDGTELCFADADDDGFVDGVDGVLSPDTDCDDPGEGSTADGSGECDDTDPAVHPGAPETPGDGVDSDCDGGELCYADSDGDGFVDGSTTVASTDPDCLDDGEAPATAPTRECDDTDARVHPGATDSVGDGIDSDCDGVELCYADSDGDGFVDGTTTVESADGTCTATGEARLDAPRGECNDADPSIFPGAPEQTGDGVDSDCDGGEVCFVDADADGFADLTATVGSADSDCDDPGEATDTLPATDCDDADPDVSPDATEVPGDGRDNNCDGSDASTTDADLDPDKGGCATAPSRGHGTSGWLVAGLLLFLGRRRRPTDTPAGSQA